jgi:hypothetical protein
MTNDTELAALVERLQAFVDNDMTERGGGRIAIYAAIKAIKSLITERDILTVHKEDLSVQVAEAQHDAMLLQARAVTAERERDEALAKLGTDLLTKAKAEAYRAVVADNDQLLNQVAQLQSDNALLQKRVEAADKLALEVELYLDLNGETRTDAFLRPVLDDYRATANADVAKDTGPRNDDKESGE